MTGSNSDRELSRILHVASGDSWAGAEAQIYNLVMELKEMGYDVQVILFNDGVLGTRLASGAIQIHVIREEDNNAFKLMAAIGKLINEFNPDLIHTHGYKQNILTCTANMFSLRRKCVCTVHGGQEHQVTWKQPIKKLVNWLNIQVYTHYLDKIIAVSDPLAADLKRIVKKDKIIVIENSINTASILKGSNDAISESYPEDIIKIACVGRLVHLKRHDLLIKAFQMACQLTEKPLHLYIYGAGPEKNNINDLIKELSLGSRVTLMGDCYPLLPHLKEMDLLVMPSDHEGLPMTILEALTLKVPIIAHAVGGIPKVLGHGRYGRLVTRHEPEGYMEAIINVIDDPEATAAVVESGYNHVRSKYDIKQNIVNYDKFYRSLLQ